MAEIHVCPEGHGNLYFCHANELYHGFPAPVLKKFGELPEQILPIGVANVISGELIRTRGKTVRLKILTEREVYIFSEFKNKFSKQDIPFLMGSVPQLMKGERTELPLTEACSVMVNISPNNNAWPYKAKCYDQDFYIYRYKKAWNEIEKITQQDINTALKELMTKKILPKRVMVRLVLIIENPCLSFEPEKATKEDTTLQLDALAESQLQAKITGVIDKHLQEISDVVVKYFLVGPEGKFTIFINIKQ